ncbi:MAG: hypothetical protein II920_07115, partial [Clostridia bacterium]|nr:hypothetical protein [Clostridia bacterium]
MKFSIGYQLPDEFDSTAEIVNDYIENISSVYFALPGQASARNAIDASDREEMLEELKFIRSLGVSLSLLYNANCYGAGAVSEAFRQEIVSDIGNLTDKLELTDITTTSPFVARVAKAAFPQLRVTASVNMWIGTTQAMKYLGDDFDCFYMQREYNRSFKKIKELSSWCVANGKKLKMLANSGCLYTCPFHIFHDNLVAHEKEASLLGNAVSKRPSPCWDMMYSLPKEEAAAVYLQESWIRPNDIAKYEGFFSEVKLATRMHSNPRRVVAAYVSGRFYGNMFDLTEPSYSMRFDKEIL